MQLPRINVFQHFSVSSQPLGRVPAHPVVCFGATTAIVGQDVFQRNVSPLMRKIQAWDAWADKAISEIRQNEADPAHTGKKYFMPLEHAQANPVAPATGVRQKENASTMALYEGLFRDPMWTGIECSNPINPDGIRYDELGMFGVYNPEKLAKQVQRMADLQIENVRLGIPNHKRNWDNFTPILDAFAKAKVNGEKVKISLDLNHFGLPDQLANPANPAKSYYLNPKWPAYFQSVVRNVVSRYYDKLEAFTLINEPMVINKFSASTWNEKMPGDSKRAKAHSKRNYNHYFIERAFLIAEAAINGRIAIEKYRQQHDKPGKIFIHNESLEHRLGDDDFNKFTRFLTTDLILNQDWLKGDYKKTPMYDFLKRGYVLSQPERRQPAMQRRLDASLEKIRGLHQKLQKETGKTMTSDTVFGIDYYAACESQTDKYAQEHKIKISHDPAHYTAQAQDGQSRQGLYRLGREYWDRYKLPMLHTETNMKNDNQSYWGKQQMLEMALLKKAGVPILGFNWYSLLDQRGWDAGLKPHPSKANHNPLGLLNSETENYDVRPFAAINLPELRNAGVYGRADLAELPSPHVGPASATQFKGAIA